MSSVDRKSIRFIAGFVAVIVFHQGVLVLLHGIGFAANPP